MNKEKVLKGGLREKNIFKNNKGNQPLISIITPILNNEKYLQECLNSLHNQTYSNYEHIVVDGGSFDKTLDIIKENENKIDFWMSKKDRGIYDAFNQGMSLSRGDIIGFLNSDDYYYSNQTLNYVEEAFRNNHGLHTGDGRSSWTQSSAWPLSWVFDQGIGTDLDDRYEQFSREDGHRSL